MRWVMMFTAETVGCVAEWCFTGTWSIPGTLCRQWFLTGSLSPVYRL